MYSYCWITITPIHLQNFPKLKPCNHVDSNASFASSGSWAGGRYSEVEILDNFSGCICSAAWQVTCCFTHQVPWHAHFVISVHKPALCWSRCRWSHVCPVKSCPLIPQTPGTYFPNGFNESFAEYPHFLPPSLEVLLSIRKIFRVIDTSRLFQRCNYFSMAFQDVCFWIGPYYEKPAKRNQFCQVSPMDKWVNWPVDQGLWVFFTQRPGRGYL